MKIKNLLLAATAALMLGAAGATSAKADLVFATDAAPYPPFTSQNAAGEWEGWEYDLLQALCAEMNEKCTLIPIAWDGIIPHSSKRKWTASSAPCRSRPSARSRSTSPTCTTTRLR